MEVDTGAASLVPRPEEAEEEKGPGFNRSRTRGSAREKRFHCHMVSLLTSIVYFELKQLVYLCASIHDVCEYSRCLR